MNAMGLSQNQVDLSLPYFSPMLIIA